MSPSLFPRLTKMKLPVVASVFHRSCRVKSFSECLFLLLEMRLLALCICKAMLHMMIYGQSYHLSSTASLYFPPLGLAIWVVLLFPLRRNFLVSSASLATVNALLLTLGNISVESHSLKDYEVRRCSPIILLAM